MQGFNKYYPPDYNPDAGSLNKSQGKHALGDRARKLDQGILIVRFELPYNIWCGGCKGHIGMGVRYNAEKKKVGMYYSSPIFAFRCKCHLCSHWFEIRTDPQNTRYVVHEGAKQQAQDWDPAENGGVVLADKPLDDSDAFATLERTIAQKAVAQSAASRLASLESLQSARGSDPYAASYALRSTFRKAKKVRLESEGRAEGIRDRYGLGERVRMSDLRTPGREVKDIEDREWEEAQREREKRQGVREGKRRKEVESVGWRPTPASSSSRRRSEGTLRIASTSSKPQSSAVKSLAAQVLLNSAVKADPFRSGFLPNERDKSMGSSKVKVVRKG